MTDLVSLRPQAEQLIALCAEKSLMIATAESCTGGLVAGLLTEIAGSSAVVDRGFVTYSNEAKNEMIGVPLPLLEEHGAVSKQVALAMAHGALGRARAQIAVSITGIAGPGGGSPDKPVGLVHFAVKASSGFEHHEEARFGDLGREVIRHKSVATAIKLLKIAAEQS
ncbi:MULTISPECIES: CinA family protein [Pseudovibrio]|uniref:CinA family protein n=1 Tax=Stappiaceae TaxID=2821832 RepID=UPI002366636F|nr:MULTISPECIES: CinA family protein [Pseudovibrio]MDD7908712.1 CinA family protein [Pseudovibrio exalbescens]MDX5592785.1 CinA family protein [Pseudovibrio sp. SPO723]